MNANINRHLANNTKYGEFDKRPPEKSARN